MRAWAIWWTDPAKLLLFITTPAVLLSAWLGGPQMYLYQSRDFITPTVMVLLVASLAAVTAGAKVGDRLGSSTAPRARMDPRRVQQAIIALSVVSILCHLIYMGAALSNPGDLMAVLQGERGAIYRVKASINKIPGLTSFTQLFVLALPLYAAFRGYFGFRPSRATTRAVQVLFVMVLLRAIFGAERFAIIEFAVAYAIPKLTYRTAPLSPRLAFAPLAGFAAMLLLFAAGEYTRSWAYYRGLFPDFGTFVTARLAGYVATATNNGAGFFETMGSVGAPAFTAAWFRKLPFWGDGGPPFGAQKPLELFLLKYATPEFNNPGGVLAGIMDYGVVLGLAFMLGTGLLGGYLYGRFKRESALGILAFPSAYLGFLMLTQAYYWGESRMFTVWVAVPFVLAFILPTWRAGALRTAAGGTR